MVKPHEHPETWYSLEQAATLCERKPRTILNLVSLHGLPRQRLWVTQRRLRRRRLRLSPSVVAYLQMITIKGFKPQHVVKPLK